VHKSILIVSQKKETLVLLIWLDKWLELIFCDLNSLVKMLLSDFNDGVWFIVEDIKRYSSSFE